MHTKTSWPGFVHLNAFRFIFIMPLAVGLSVAMYITVDAV